MYVFRFCESPRWGAVAQAGHRWKWPGNSKSQVWHIVALHTPHRRTACTPGCLAHTTPSASGRTGEGNNCPGAYAIPAAPLALMHLGQRWLSGIIDSVSEGGRGITKSHVVHIHASQPAHRCAACTVGCWTHLGTD